MDFFETLATFSNRYLELISIRPSELSDRLQQLFKSSERDKFIANEEKFLYILENLDIQVGVIEK